MPLSVRIARTVVWLGLALIPAAVQFLFVVPPLAQLAAGAGIPLPLPTRLVIGMSEIVLPVFEMAIVFAAVLVVVTAIRRRVPLPELARLLFTWRRQNWDTPAGRKLLANEQRQPGV
jgi:type II secretory pathway component PulF